MSERQEKRKRRIQRGRYYEALNIWRRNRQPMILLWRWIKWKRNKPKLKDFKVKE